MYLLNLAFLTKLNFSATSKIGILLSNPIDILELYFSCLQLNVIPIIFPSDITNDELQKIIDHHKISLIITEWVRKHQVVSVKNSDFFTFKNCHLIMEAVLI